MLRRTDSDGGKWIMSGGGGGYNETEFSGLFGGFKRRLYAVMARISSVGQS